MHCNVTKNRNKKNIALLTAPRVELWISNSPEEARDLIKQQQLVCINVGFWLPRLQSDLII